MCIRFALWALLAAAGLAPPAPAAFVVTFGPASVPAGGTGTVDVFVSGPARLDFFVAEFRITPVGAAQAGGLRFTTTPPLPPLTASNYVFVGNSFAASQLPTNPGAVTTSLTQGDTYTVGDFTLDNLGVDVSAPRLLGRLSFTADGSIPNGSQYILSLNPLGSQFQDPAFADIPFTSTPGTITVTAGPPVQAVSEPASVLLLLTGAAVAGIRARLSGRASARRLT